MELTYAEIVGAADAFSRMTSQRLNIDLDTAIRLEKNKRAINKVLRIYNAINSQLIHTHGKPPVKDDPKKNTWHIPEEDVDSLTKYWSVYDDLMCKTEDVDIHLLKRADIDLLRKNLNIADQGALFFLLQTSQEDAGLSSPE